MLRPGCIRQEGKKRKRRSSRAKRRRTFGRLFDGPTSGQTPDLPSLLLFGVILLRWERRGSSCCCYFFSSELFDPDCPSTPSYPVSLLPTHLPSPQSWSRPISTRPLTFPSVRYMFVFLDVSNLVTTNTLLFLHRFWSRIKSGSPLF